MKSPPWRLWRLRAAGNGALGRVGDARVPSQRARAVSIAAMADDSDVVFIADLWDRPQFSVWHIWFGRAFG